MNELKLQSLILSQIILKENGLPTNDYVEQKIILASNLFNAINYSGNSTRDTFLLQNELNNVLGDADILVNYTQGLFSGYFRTKV